MYYIIKSGCLASTYQLDIKSSSRRAISCGDFSILGIRIIVKKKNE